MGTMHIFLSHSHKDISWCSEFVKVIKDKNTELDIWFDVEGLFVGDEWVQTIEREIQHCDIFLIIISPHAWQSAWVKKELALALAQHKPILGVIHESTPLEGFITTYQLLDVSKKSPQEAAEIILHNIESKTWKQPRNPLHLPKKNRAPTFRHIISIILVLIVV